MSPQTEVANDTPSTPAAPAAVSAKPVTGFKSSELAVTVATAIPLVLGCVPANYAPLVAAVGGVYVAARTLLKVVHALGYAKALPDLPQLPPVQGSDGAVK